jgi:hypothetical protein
MNSLRKILLSLAGVVLVSSSITCTWMTLRSVANEIPAIGCISPLKWLAGHHGKRPDFNSRGIHV